MLSSSVKHFNFPFTCSALRRQAAFRFVAKAETAFSELLLQTTQEEEVTGSLATANRISIDLKGRQDFSNQILKF